MLPVLRSWAEPGAQLQHPFEAAVVMPSILRPSIAEALRSVFAQEGTGPVQVLVGADRPGDLAPLEAACAERPPHISVQLLWPGYSTSARHGGFSPAWDGGALRTILSYLANAPYVAYLDDDNWWRPDHLCTLLAAVRRADWAFSLRWFVHPVTRQPICVDEWESMGPGQGVFAESFGGFVDPNCLMLNKLVCEPALACWNQPLAGDTTGLTADRRVFDMLMRNFRGLGTDQPTSFYRVDPNDGRHPIRLQQMGAAWHAAGVARG